MNIEGGALEFDAVLNNRQLNGAITEAERRIRGLSQTTVSEGEKMDDTFKNVADRIALSKDLIKQTEIDIKALEKEIKKLAPGKAQSELIAECNAAKRALQEEKNILAELETQAKQTEQAHVAIRTRIRELKEALVELEIAGERGSERYNQMRDELAYLSDALDDITQQNRILANDEANYQGLIVAISGVAGGFTAAQGAMSLFVGENENLQKIMLKVQSLMAITVGLQQVAQALNKDSAFMLVTVAKAKTLLAAATNKLTVALGISNVAAKALLATLTLGLSVAITAVIALWNKFSSAQKKAREEQKKFAEKAVESAYKILVEYERLRQEWEKLGDAIADKEKFIRKNEDAFKSLGVEIENAKDAENLFINSKDKFIDSIIAKAKAAAAMELAAEKYKESLLKMQEADAMKDTITKTSYTSYTYGGGRSNTYEVENKKKKKLKDEVEKLEQEAKAWITKGIEQTAEGNKKLEEANIKTVETLIEGSVAALEAAISQKKKALKNLTNPADYKKAVQEIKAEEKKLAKITGEKTSTKDPFTELLEKRKKQYQTFASWVNSGDEILIKTASNEFATLLKEGDNYLDYLKKQRQKLLELSNPTKTEKTKLKKLNDEIAAETKKTILDDFNRDLSEELSNARSIMDMLKIIEERRKLLANDNTDMDNRKKEMLNDAQRDVGKRAKEETNELIENYASYLSRKIRLEEKFANDMHLLNKRLKEAKTQADKKEVEGAIKNRRAAFENEMKKSGDDNFDNLLQEYGTFEQKKLIIQNEFEEKRRIAKEHGDKELLTRLLDEEQKALSNLATEELTNSNIWKQLFGNLDELTAAQISILIEEIEKQFDSLSVKFDPVDLNTIRNKLNEARQILVEDNPFKQVGIAIKEILNDAAEGSKDSSARIKTNWKNLSSAVEGSFKFVDDAVKSCDFLADVIGDVGATAISSLNTIATVSIAVTAAIKTAEKASVVLAIIQAALAVAQMFANIFQSIFAAGDKKIEKSIGRHRDAVQALNDAYKNLERNIQKALGGDSYTNQRKAIENLQQQRLHLLEMKRLEEDKKKTDGNKVREYEQAFIEAGQKIEDILAEIAQSITQTTAKDLANELADAICDAFAKGENAAEKFEEVSRKVMQNAVKNALKLQFLEKPLQKAIDDLQKSMGYWKDDVFIFDGLTDAEQQRFKNQISSIGASFAEAMKMYEDLFKDLDSEEFDTSLTGAVKGVTEETASILAGQINAVRINQMEANELMKQQLFSLQQIANNTSYNVHLEQLTEIVDLIKNGAFDPLRAQGL